MKASAGARRRRVRLAVLAGALVLGAVAARAGVAALTVHEAGRVRTLPAPSGPYAVGRRFIAWRDEARADPLAPDSAARRELVAWVWYPAVPLPHARPAPYLPAEWVRALRRERRQQRLDRVHAHAIDGAPVAADQPSHAVLVFAPGLGQLPTAYTTLAEELASHGYFVVAVAHPFSTPAVVFPDGHVARAEQRRVPFAFHTTVSVLAGDLVSALDHVVRAHDRGDALFARIDPGRIGVLGHSFGGAAAAEACRMDSRFRAGMNLDGTLFGEAVTKGVRQPFLMVLGDLGWRERFRREPPRYVPGHDQARVHEEMLFARSPTAYGLIVSRLSHMNFGDGAFFFDPGERLAERLGMRLDGRRTHALTSAYARAFFGRYLDGVESAGGELERSPYPFARLEAHRRQ